MLLYPTCTVSDGSSGGISLAAVTNEPHLAGRAFQTTVQNWSRWPYRTATVDSQTDFGRFSPAFSDVTGCERPDEHWLCCGFCVSPVFADCRPTPRFCYQCVTREVPVRGSGPAHLIGNQGVAGNAQRVAPQLGSADERSVGSRMVLAIGRRLQDAPWPVSAEKPRVRRLCRNYGIRLPPAPRLRFVSDVCQSRSWRKLKETSFHWPASFCHTRSVELLKRHGPACFQLTRLLLRRAMRKRSTSVSNGGRGDLRTPCPRRAIITGSHVDARSPLESNPPRVHRSFTAGELPAGSRSAAEPDDNRVTRSMPSGVRTDLASTAALMSRCLTVSCVSAAGHGTS